MFIELFTNPPFVILSRFFIPVEIFSYFFFVNSFFFVTVFISVLFSFFGSLVVFVEFIFSVDFFCRPSFFIIVYGIGV